ncbi:TPA: hypothetical protein P7R30_003496 [Escherichia coli]|nr:hypothetical protein [Escherichia coli]
MSDWRCASAASTAAPCCASVSVICRSVLKKHRETVTLMGFTPTHLSLAIGMLNGVFKER